MWRKTTEAKPSPQASDTPASAPAVSAPKSTPPAVVPVQGNAMPAKVPSIASGTQSGTSSVTSGLQIHGEISGNADLYIDGEVQGKIRLQKSKVTVGPNGRVLADIEAREIAVDGKVQGNLKAGDCVRLGPSSRVQGNVAAPRIAIADGAKLRGKVETTRAEEPRAKSVTKLEQATDSEAQRPVAAQAGDE